MLSYAVVLAALGAQALAQTTTAPSGPAAQTTISALVGTFSGGFVGSVVGVGCGETTIAIACADSDACSDATLTATQGSTDYQLDFSTTIEGAAASISESCSLGGPSGSPTTASCVAVISASANGKHEKTTTSYAVPSESLSYGTIAVTAGASKLTATSACSAGGAVATAVAEVYKVVVPVGAAMIAGALL